MNNINNAYNKNNLQNVKKQIIYHKNYNFLDNSSLINNINNEIKNVLELKKIDKKKVNNDNINNSKDNILADFHSIKKNFPFLNKILKNIINNNKSKKKNSKQKKLINDKIISKHYIRNISQNNNSINLNSYKTNINNQRHKINHTLMTINNNINNKSFNIKNKTPFSYRNNIKSIIIVRPKHFHNILNNYKNS